MRTYVGIAAVVVSGISPRLSQAAPVFYPTASPLGHWFVSTNVAPGGDGNFASFVTNNFQQAVNVTYTPARADWIADVPGGSHGGVGNWTFFVFRQTFDLTGYNPAVAALTFRWAADDSGEIIAFRGSWIPAFRLNGGAFINYPGSTPDHRIPTYDFSPWITLTKGFVAGVNTIDFYVEGNGQTDGFGLQVQSFTACAGDLNHDGFVDDADFSFFVAAYDILDCADPAMPPNCPSDLNGDGLVDDADFTVFVASYNELICP
ncbi:MAG: hypothetical protein KF691_03775 [Phycisphaeraceae bacterium]|nr:hypothetical protein [Phycisphaeraceae bacterium]